MKKIILSYLISIITLTTFGQNGVGIGTVSPHSSAALDISSTTKGLLIPRMTGTQRTAIVSPVAGLLVYDTEAKSLYQYNGTSWGAIGGSAGGQLTLPFAASDAGAVSFQVNNTMAGGKAIVGKANANSINSIAISGEAAVGIAIKGYSNDAGSIGVFGSSLSGTGVSATSFAGTALEVNGKLKISGGNTNPSAGAVLTSDAVGNAVWKERKIGFSVSDVNPNLLNVPSNTNTTVHLFNEEFDYGNDYAAYSGSSPSFGNSLFVVPVTGLYHFDAALALERFNDDLLFPMLRIVVQRGATFTNAVEAEFSPFIRNSLGMDLAQAVISKDVRLVAGDLVTLRVFHTSSGPAAIWRYGSNPHFGAHLVFAE